MKQIKVRTENAYIRKREQLRRLFDKCIDANTRNIHEIFGEIAKRRRYLRSVSMSLSTAKFKKYNDDILRLEKLLKVENAKSYPKQYPNGVILIYERKCPYCGNLREYSRCSEPYGLAWKGLPVPLHPMGVPDLRPARVKKANPEICPDCVSDVIKAMDRPRKKKRSKGFWDSIFG